MKPGKSNFSKLDFHRPACQKDFFDTLGFLSYQDRFNMNRMVAFSFCKNACMWSMGYGIRGIQSSLMSGDASLSRMEVSGGKPSWGGGSKMVRAWSCGCAMMGSNESGFSSPAIYRCSSFSKDPMVVQENPEQLVMDRSTT